MEDIIWAITVKSLTATAATVVWVADTAIASLSYRKKSRFVCSTVECLLNCRLRAHSRVYHDVSSKQGFCRQIRIRHSVEKIEYQIFAVDFAAIFNYNCCWSPSHSWGWGWRASSTSHKSRKIDLDPSEHQDLFHELSSSFRGIRFPIPNFTVISSMFSISCCWGTGRFLANKLKLDKVLYRREKGKISVRLTVLQLCRPQALSIRTSQPPKCRLVVYTSKQST